jgi:hypothetical protein
VIQKPIYNKDVPSQLLATHSIIFPRGQTYQTTPTVAVVEEGLEENANDGRE